MHIGDTELSLSSIPHLGLRSFLRRRQQAVGSPLKIIVIRWLLRKNHPPPGSFLWRASGFAGAEVEAEHVGRAVALAAALRSDWRACAAATGQ